MIAATASAVSGMQAATLRLAASASKIAGAGAAAPAGSPPTYLLLRIEGTSLPMAGGSGVSVGAVRSVSPTWLAGQGPDLADALLEQAGAEADFLANAKVLQTAQEMVKRLYELTG
jgi:hypothetical protein